MPTRKVILVVIDGLTPGLLERGLDEGRAPVLAELADRGTYTRGTTVFPSVTPVCLTSIATGAFPDVHGIPGLAWYHRGEERIVEYGSSFPAMRAVGALIVAHKHETSLKNLSSLNFNLKNLGIQVVGSVLSEF